MDIFAFNSETLLSFLLTLMRVSLIVFLMPFYGGESIPAPIKAALCLILSLALWQLVKQAVFLFMALIVLVRIPYLTL